MLGMHAHAGGFPAGCRLNGIDNDLRTSSLHRGRVDNHHVRRVGAKDFAAYLNTLAF